MKWNLLKQYIVMILSVNSTHLILNLLKKCIVYNTKSIVYTCSEVDSAEYNVKCEFAEGI